MLIQETSFPVNLDTLFDQIHKGHKPGHVVEIGELSNRRRDFAYSSVISLAQTVGSAARILTGSCSRSQKPPSEHLKRSALNLGKAGFYFVGVISPQTGNILNRAFLSYVFNPPVVERNMRPNPSRKGTPVQVK